MAGVKKITYKGVEIIFADYKNCKSEAEMLEILHQMAETVKKLDGPYLQLADLTNAYLTKGYMQELKKMAKTLPQTAKKRAIVGMNSKAKKILLEIYNMLIAKDKVTPFDTLEEAKEWLIK